MAPTTELEHLSYIFNELDPEMKDRLLAVRGKSVLLVEDNADNRAFLGRFINFFGAEVDFAENGLEGVHKALGQTYDVVLMDIQMPILDGIEATQELRARGYEGPVVAITAHSMNEEREICLRAGFDEYLTKPINRARLLQAISTQVRNKQVGNRSALH